MEPISESADDIQEEYEKNKAVQIQSLWITVIHAYEVYFLNFFTRIDYESDLEQISVDENYKSWILRFCLLYRGRNNKFVETFSVALV